MAALVFVGIIVYWVDANLRQSLEAGHGEPFLWLEGISVWPSLVLRFTGLATTIALAFFFKIRNDRQANEIAECFGLGIPRRWELERRWWQKLLIGPHLDLATFGSQGKANQTCGTPIRNSILWRNYLRATGKREAIYWIGLAVVLTFGVGVGAFKISGIYGQPSFPGRGGLVADLNKWSLWASVPALWFTVYWVAYETRACAGFIKILSDVRRVQLEWANPCTEVEDYLPPGAYRDAFLAFRLIVRATRRVQGLIYLPFVSILFMVAARSDLFDAMDFPLPLVFVNGLALAYALSSAVLLRRGAEAARKTILQQIEDLTLRTELRKPTGDTKDRLQISPDQIKLGVERIRCTREGAFAPFSEQPALQAFLLPFGGYGGLQLIESLLFNLKP